MKYNEFLQKKAALIQRLEAVNDELALEDLFARIKETNKALQDYGQEREKARVTVEGYIRDYDFKLVDFAYEIQMRMNPPKSAIEEPEAESKKAKTKVAKPELIVGTFWLSDYGFKMPTNSKGDPMSHATSLVWNANQRYGGRSWEQSFIATILQGGIDKAQRYFSDAFQAWLEETITNQKGRYAGKPVYNNKKDFYAKFGVDIDPLTGEAVTKAAQPSVAQPTIVTVGSSY
ncbi:hypothetical protein [Candidatus Symbiobacter mobilis]|uniref:Uncharacterized protein n=1 Tax=Candidatus Symbiobacter mobilis CR TaxID=946483 RepID=U5N8W2_9BURK|nr:hypothetical protein [Candidatus Symbiobacter mobilis]AGX87981.1 hypothetical protein Cenrod_1903 [Candidatus Symbiobacter mobilis CR]